LAAVARSPQVPFPGQAGSGPCGGRRARARLPAGDAGDRAPAAPLVDKIFTRPSQPDASLLDG